MNFFFVKIVPGNPVEDIYSSEDRGYGIRALAIDFELAICDILPGFAQDREYIDSAAATQSNQHRFHRSGSLIVATYFRRTINRDLVAAFR